MAFHALLRGPPFLNSLFLFDPQGVSKCSLSYFPKDLLSKLSPYVPSKLSPRPRKLMNCDVGSLKIGTIGYRQPAGGKWLRSSGITADSNALPFTVPFAFSLFRLSLQGLLSIIPSVESNQWLLLLKALLEDRSHVVMSRVSIHRPFVHLAPPASALILLVLSFLAP